MSLYELSAEAQLDYFDAFDFIAEHSTRAALQWEQRMLDSFDHLAEWPHTGRIRPEYAPPSLRFWVEGEYLVVYDPSTEPLSLVAVLHGAQDIAELISKRMFESDDDEQHNQG